MVYQFEPQTFEEHQREKHVARRDTRLGDLVAGAKEQEISEYMAGAENREQARLNDLVAGKTAQASASVQAQRDQNEYEAGIVSRLGAPIVAAIASDDPRIRLSEDEFWAAKDNMRMQLQKRGVADSSSIMQMDRKSFAMAVGQARSLEEQAKSRLESEKSQHKMAEKRAEKGQLSADVERQQTGATTRTRMTTQSAERRANVAAASRERVAAARGTGGDKALSPSAQEMKVTENWLAGLDDFTARVSPSEEGTAIVDIAFEAKSRHAELGGQYIDHLRSAYSDWLDMQGEPEEDGGMFGKVKEFFGMDEGGIDMDQYDMLRDSDGTIVYKHKETGDLTTIIK